MIISRKKIAFTLGPVELHDQITESENITIIDVRVNRRIIKKGHIPGALNLPKPAMGNVQRTLHEGVP